MNKHITMHLDNLTSYLKDKPSAEFEPLGFKGWRGRAVEDSGLFTFMFDIAPDSEPYPLHTDHSAWLAYVIKGSGTLLGGTEPEDVTCEVKFQAGDYITFDPSTPHAWRNDNVSTQILFMKVA